MRPLALAAGVALAALSARRAALLGAALLPAPAEPNGDSDRSVVLLVPANDEAPTLGHLLASIERLEWPRDRLSVVLVDDGSEDGTWELMHRWATGNDNALAVRLGRRSGKARALNAALEAAPPGEIAVVCDADLRLGPGYLSRLVPAFGDPSVGAASGFVTSANAGTSVVSRYAALETWVHQLVTAAGKHRLGLNPPTFAGSAYRRSALEAIGGFADARAGDDVEASAALTRSGWRTCFVRRAQADHILVEGPTDYWRQHLRWGRNVLDAGRADTNGGGRAPRRRRVELGLAAVGYGDRIAFAAAVLLAARGRIPPAVPAAYASLRALETVVAVVKAGEARRLPAYLAAVPVVLPLDVAASLAGAIALRSPVPPAWRGSRRRPRSDRPSGPLE
jgi:glycosyltransferase involved in cell wall biosynthesis